MKRLLYLTQVIPLLVLALFLSQACQRPGPSSSSSTTTVPTDLSIESMQVLLGLITSTTSSTTTTSLPVKSLTEPNNSDTLMPFLRQFARDLVLTKPISASDRTKGPLVDLSQTKGLSYQNLSLVIKTFCKDYAQDTLKAPNYAPQLSLQLAKPSNTTKNFLLTFSSIRFLTIIKVDDNELALAVYLSGVNEAKYLDIYLNKSEKGNYNVTDAYFRDQGSSLGWTGDGVPDATSRDLQERMRKKAWQ